MTYFSCHCFWQRIKSRWSTFHRGLLLVKHLSLLPGSHHCLCLCDKESSSGWVHINRTLWRLFMVNILHLTSLPRPDSSKLMWVAAQGWDVGQVWGVIGGLLTAWQWCASAEKPAAPTFTGAPARCHLPTTPLYKCTHRTLFYLFNQIMIELQPGEASDTYHGWISPRN